MSNLSTFSEIGLVDARASAGTLIVPKSTDIPGRIITFKDIYGAVANSTIALLTSTGDVFEDGTNYRTLTNPYDIITLYASSTGVWYVVGGTQFNAIRAPIMSNSSNLTSSITANTINTPYTYTSFLYPQVGLSNTTTSNLVPPVNATTTGASIGLPTSNYLQVFTQSTFTSNIVGGSVDPRSTILLGNSFTPAYSTSRISTISLGNPTNRFFQGFFVSTITSSITTDLVAAGNISTQTLTGFNLIGTTILSTQQIFCSSLQIGPADAILDVLGPIRSQDISTLTLEASTITSGTMTLDRIFGGPITGATASGNVYPFSAGATIGFGATVSSNGFYAEGHFRSTFTQYIQPTLDAGLFSNIIYINGNVSTQNVYLSSLFANNITTSTISSLITTTSTTNTNYLSSGTGFISSLNVNSLTFGTGTGYAAFTALQGGLVSSIESDAGVQKVSSVNAKLPPFWSTLNIPTSSFNINGANAGTPIVLYSNVQFPPYTKGMYKIYQKGILTKTGGATSLDMHPNLFYTQGIFPSSTTLFHDGYSALPYVNNTGTSTFTTCITLVTISSITTRNICYYDAVANSYTANLYLGNLAVEYIPSLGGASDIGQNIYNS